MCPCALRKMIQKFETTGQLAILLNRERKQIPSARVENGATAVVEASSQSPPGSVSVPVVSHVLVIPYSTKRKIPTTVFEFLSLFKIIPVQLLKDGNPQVSTLSH
ncbi:DUF4817 domain-containing protein [Caerostris extrusa]|uniref:DUF4817 domain-containing protein n=1 Tax=Caerostris extrusa TaxID=172846 RepID=A0AAV4W275_CAEEX|nr:DUF4817 domain-containing protein [Caerostris extrusa]